MLWQGQQWQCYPLDVLRVRPDTHGVEIFNTVTTHYHVRIVLQKVLVADFRSELTLAGDFRDLQLVDASGEDRALWVNPSELGIHTSFPQTYQISRHGGHVEVEQAARGALPIGNYRANPVMPCLLSVAIETGKRVCIQSWACWEESTRRE